MGGSMPKGLPEDLKQPIKKNYKNLQTKDEFNEAIDTFKKAVQCTNVRSLGIPAAWRESYKTYRSLSRTREKVYHEMCRRDSASTPATHTRRGGKHIDSRGMCIRDSYTDEDYKSTWEELQPPDKLDEPYPDLSTQNIETAREKYLDEQEEECKKEEATQNLRSVLGQFLPEKKLEGPPKKTENKKEKPPKKTEKKKKKDGVKH